VYNMNRYRAIYRRKSTREYSDEQLSKGIMKKIRKSVDKIKKLYDDIDMDIKILKRDALKSAVSGFIFDYGKVDSPYYMVVGTEKKKRCAENVGFSVEPVVLDLTRWKIGSCWLGANFDKEKVRKKAGLNEELEPIVLIAFGRTAENKSPWRDNRKNAGRKELSKLLLDETDPLSKKWKKILDAGRYAPSAVNSQPWRFEKEDGLLHLYIAEKQGLLKSTLNKFVNLERLNRIDAGICLSHLKIAADHSSKDLSLKRLEGMEKKDYNYIISLEG